MAMLPNLRCCWKGFPPQPFGGARFSSVGGVQKPIRPLFSPSRHTSPAIFTVPPISSAYAGAGLGRRSSIRPRIFRNSSFGTATSANWSVTYRPWRTTLAPILTSFSRSVVSDQCSTSFGKASVPHSTVRSLESEAKGQL